MAALDVSLEDPAVIVGAPFRPSIVCCNRLFKVTFLSFQQLVGCSRLALLLSVTSDCLSKRRQKACMPVLLQPSPFLHKAHGCPSGDAKLHTALNTIGAPDENAKALTRTDAWAYTSLQGHLLNCDVPEAAHDRRSVTRLQCRRAQKNAFGHQIEDDRMFLGLLRSVTTDTLRTTAALSSEALLFRVQMPCSQSLNYYPNFPVVYYAALL